MDYFILKPNGEQTGTFSFEQIRAMLEKGAIGPDTQYWHEGLDGWRPVTRIEESLNFQPPPTTSKSSTKPQSVTLPPTSRAVVRPDSALKKSTGKIVQTVTAQARPPSPTPAPKPVDSEAPSQPNSPTQPNIPTQAERINIEPSTPVIAKKSRLLHWLFYAASVVVLALLIDYGSTILHTASNLFQSEITLNNDETYVLLDPTAIKSFTDDMRNFPPLDGLRHRLEQATDPASRTDLALAVQKSTSLHTNEIEQRYFAMHKAERIAPGAYKVLKRYDDRGNPTSLPAGASTWYAISCQGLTVYAHKSPDTPAP